MPHASGHITLTYLTFTHCPSQCSSGSSGGRYRCFWERLLLCCCRFHRGCGCSCCYRCRGRGRCCEARRCRRRRRRRRRESSGYGPCGRRAPAAIALSLQSSPLGGGGSREVQARRRSLRAYVEPEGVAGSGQPEINAICDQGPLRGHAGGHQGRSSRPRRAG